MFEAAGGDPDADPSGHPGLRTRGINHLAARLDRHGVVGVADAVLRAHHDAERDRDADRALRPLDLIAEHAVAEVRAVRLLDRAAGDDVAAEDELVVDPAGDRAAVAAHGDLDRPDGVPGALLAVALEDLAPVVGLVTVPLGAQPGAEIAVRALRLGAAALLGARDLPGGRGRNEGQAAGDQDER